MIDSRCIDDIAAEARVSPQQVARTISLLDGGATIPFIARYRKDMTGNLNEEQLETISLRNRYFNELAMRRKTVLDAIEKQGKLTDALKTAIEECMSKPRLEDLYAPFKKARRTQATVAREKGLEPLADFLAAQDASAAAIEAKAGEFVRADKAVHDAAEALEGARNILAERVALDLGVRDDLRKRMRGEGQVISKATANGEKDPGKYKVYTDFKEAAATIPSHRFLAIHRGVKEGLLRMELSVDDDAAKAAIVAKFLTAPGTPYEEQWTLICHDAYNRLLRPSIENEMVQEIQDRADREAIHVFRQNAENLLMSPPAGPIAVMGVDPGFKNGCKLAVVDSAGTFVESAVIHPHPPQSDAESAETVLLAMLQKHDLKAIAVGNGTASRETNAFVRAMLQKAGLAEAFCVLVNEAGASVYSASKTAREEFPDLDVTVRGAISIARRLQDPLSEFVKLDPRHIGVGQYQHDVNQKRLREGLTMSVTSCVNRVGVDLNTASAPLLRYVAGMKRDTAENVVKKRAELGGFTNRGQLLEVSGVGPAVFEQAAGFLRVHGDHPLDRTGIHPEAYDIVAKVAARLNMSLQELTEKPQALDSVEWAEFESEAIGQLALADIRQELVKPRRDPRRKFRAPSFIEGVTELAQLEEGMEAEGVVTNVTDFGAFVDIGLHQDGLVHLSELSHKFIRDPHSVVRIGQIVKVKVIGVDKDAPRISLSMKALQAAEPKEGRRRRAPRAPRQEGAADGKAQKPESAPNGAREPRSSNRGGPRGDERRGGKEGARRGKGQKPRRQDKGGRGAQRPQGPPQPSGSFNTELADQLAALKEKLGG